METTNFFSSVAALNITGDLQLPIRNSSLTMAFYSQGKPNFVDYVFF